MDISSFRQSRFFKVISNKYFITIVIFIGLMIFSPNNNIVYNFKIKKQLKELENQKEFLKKEIESDSLHFLELEKSLETAEKFGREFPDIIDTFRLERKMPLLVEIPDRHGTGRKKDFITSYITEAIGLKL